MRSIISNISILVWTITIRSTFGFPLDPPTSPSVVMQSRSATLARTTRSTTHASPITNQHFLLSESSQGLPSPRTQSQQMSDAMALKTLQGTKWRLWFDLAGQTPRQQPVILVFQGFDGQPNRGIVQLSSASTGVSTTGRWLSKPSEIRRGTVQLSARWKARLPRKPTMSPSG